MYFSQDNGENVYFINGVIFVFTQHRHTRGIKLYVIYIHLFLCYSHVSNVCELIYKTVEYFLFFFFSFGGEGRGGGEESGVERKLSFLFFFGFKLKLHLQPVTCSRSFFFFYSIWFMRVLWKKRDTYDLQTSFGSKFGSFHKPRLEGEDNMWWFLELSTR